MTDVIDLSAEREKRDGPDAHLVQVVNGEKWYTFSLSYIDGEAQFSFSIWATSYEDAERRAQLIRETLVVDCMLMAEMPG